MGPYNQNTKLSDQTEELIAAHFNKSFADAVLLEENTNSTDPEPLTSHSEIEEATTDKSVNDVESKNDEIEIQAKLDPALPVPEIKEPAPEKEPKKAISTDKLIELLDSEEADVDLSDITLIKAPKKELEGLKVVGKIDLPEPKPKTEKKEEEENADSSKTSTRKPRRKRPQLSPEEKEKRRLKAKKKKAAYEAKQERRRREEAARRQKERKKAYYEEKLKQAKPATVKPKSTKRQADPVVEPKPQKPRPKTSFGRFWAWFWRGEKFDK